jgi:isohexenylglutaconyl-CoA hydratase
MTGTQPAAAPPPLHLERRGAFWFARLDRPGRRNALSAALLRALEQACDAVAADAGARALVVWGAGGHFSAGADFDGFLAMLAEPPPAHGPDPVAAHNRAFGTALERVARLPVPTLAVVRGAAMGGGCGLACAFDRVIAADDASFAMPEVALGVAPAQIAPFVARRVGALRARWLMLSGAPLDAGAAHSAGLVDAVVPVAALGARVAEELSLLAAAEPAALRATKRIALAGLDAPLPAALDSAAVEFATLLRAGAAREGIAATRERRPPAWRVALPELPEFT